VVPPSELLYKRALVLAPGKFDTVEQLHADLIRNTLAELPSTELSETKGGLGLFCLATAGTNPEEPTGSPKEIVEHVEALQKLGYGVMVFRAQELYTISAYVNRYTKSRVHFAIGLSVLVQVFEDKYRQLAGSLLEGVARLFTQNVRVTVHPMEAKYARNRAISSGLTAWKWTETDGMVYASDLQPPEPMGFLYRYLLSSEFILPVRPGKR
jgi:hypothetical protein